MSTAAHCLYCFEVVTANLEGQKLPRLENIETSWQRYQAFQKVATVGASILEQQDGAVLNEASATLSSSEESSLPSSSSPSIISSRSSRQDIEYPLFVTWNTIKRHQHPSLRGCIGTFEAQELEVGLRTYALISALEDTRFSPITLPELTDLQCGVTLLTNFETATDPMDWEIGKHGIRLSFVHQSRRYGSTYLPDVAKEQGWTKTETIISLMRKAGWNGRREDWNKVANLSVVRYQGRVTFMGYSEWADWRSWVRESGCD